jgi:hypothetical protein
MECGGETKREREGGIERSTFYAVGLSFRAEEYRYKLHERYNCACVYTFVWAGGNG